MSEEIKNNESSNKEKIEVVKKAVIEEATRGTLKLAVPIRAASQDVTELNYDFTKLSGWDYVEAMDADAAARNIFKISAKQALCLFAKAVRKAMTNVDETDVKERIGAVDAMRAVQLATVFLIASAREANQSI